MASRIFLGFVLFTIALSMVVAGPVQTKEEKSTLELSAVKIEKREGRQFLGASGSNAQANAFSSSNSVGLNPYGNPYFGGPGFGITGSNSQAAASANSASNNFGYGK